MKTDISLIVKERSLDSLNLDKEERLFLTGSGSCWVLLSNRKSLSYEGYSVIPVQFLSMEIRDQVIQQ